MMKITALAVAFLALGFTNVAIAGDAAAGKEKAAACASCHGADGVATQGIYPNLAGQQEEYLVLSTKAYRDGARNNDMMKMFVMSLSDADIENLAAYYASL
jgi:cytochrome c553